MRCPTNPSQPANSSPWDSDPFPSKFESFLDRTAPQHVRSVISPRSDDGMSFVSRKKHNDYANVVMEMKWKQRRPQSQTQQQQQQQEQQVEDWFDEGEFGSNHFQQGEPLLHRPSRLQQPQSQHRSQNQLQNQQQPQQSQQQQRPQQQRPQQRWQQSQQSQQQQWQHQQQQSHQRQQQQWHQQQQSQNLQSQNLQSQNLQLQQQQSQQQQSQQQQSQQQQSQQQQSQQRLHPTQPSKLLAPPTSDTRPERPGRKLYRDSLPDETLQLRSQSTVRRTVDLQRRLATFDDISDTSSGCIFPMKWNIPLRSSIDDEDASIASGTSVAARRRAKAALKNSPIRTVAKPAVAAPSAGARRNVRMRMQSQRGWGGADERQSTVVESNTSFPPTLFRKSSSHPEEDVPFDPSEIEEEVNIALNELKLDHPEIDFCFDPLNSTSASHCSAESSLSGGGVGDPPSKPGTRGPPQQPRGRNSPVTVGSIKTLTTKSITVESSLDSQIVAVPPSQHRGSSQSHPHRPATAYPQSQSVTSKPNNIISPVISVSESVEQYSESSSLTDTSDWHALGGGVPASGGNMFKDATKGSTFHKSKKIVRPGQSIPENNVMSGSRVGDVGANSAGRDAVEKEEVPLPSIKDRISQFKNQALVGSTLPSVTPQRVVPQRTVAEGEASPRINDFVPISTPRRINKLPPSSHAGPLSPFPVKLRKTNHILDDAAPRTHDVEDTPTGALPSNPFLSNVKLRKTGNSLRDNPIVMRETSVESEPIHNNNRVNDVPIDEQDSVLAPVEEPKRKLTYREQQELLKSQQVPKDENVAPISEPKKDVATLIRERIAMSKQSDLVLPRNDDGEVTDLNTLRGNLKRTSYVNREPTPAASLVESPPASYPTPSPPIEKLGSLPDPPDPPSTKSSPRRATSLIRSPGATTADPYATLMSAIHKSASPDEDSEGDSSPRANLEFMLARRSGPAAIRDGSNNIKQRSRSSPPKSVRSDEFDAAGFDGRLPLKHDPKFEKYFKMLKVGMPLPVVQHAMTRDGLDPSVMEGNHDEPVPEPKPEGVSLKDDPAYTKYFKMLKLGLPMGAVKNAMERDGMDGSIMDGDHNAPASVLAANSPSTKTKQKDTHRRTRLHWDTLGKVKSNTVWALLGEDEDLDNIEIDETEFINLFQAEIKSSSAAVERSNSSSRNVVQVIDPKRANNGGIILARLRMSYDDMAQAVDRIDENVMSANQAQGIFEYMPTLDERKKLREYMTGGGDSAFKFEKLCECEKFMVAMMTVKQSKRKLRALLFKLQFRGCIHDLAHDVYSIEKACDELSNSIRLRKLFGIVLNIGNRLNTAGPGEKRKAGAFSIKSLLKLNQAKAFDNKTTFLHYVVLVVQRNSELLLDFKQDLPTVLKADKIFWDQCVNELEEVETQLENVRKLALHEAKTTEIVYSLPNKCKTEEDNDSDELSVASMTLEEEVALLRSTKIGMFALSAIKKVSQLRERVDTARAKFCRLLEYFGEDGKTSSMQPHELFEIMSTFCRNFDVAREDVMKIEKAKKRDVKKEKGEDNSQKAEDASKKQTITPTKINNPTRVAAPSKSPVLRSSSFQPNMSSVLADLKRATFSRPETGVNDTRNASARSQPPEYVTPSICPQLVGSPPNRISQASQNTSSSSAHHAQSHTTPVKSVGPWGHSSGRPLSINNPSIKYPHDEPSTPEIKSTSVQQSLLHTNDKQDTSLGDQQSFESERGMIQVSSSDVSSEPKSTALKAIPPLSSKTTRREVRSQPLPQSVPMITTEPYSPGASETPSPMTTESQEKSVRTTSHSPAASNSNARAAARDRYARHKKLMYQRQSTK